MLHWLVESAQNMTEPPEAFLSAAELEKYRAFRFEKRRSDWLLGRWTAKRLLQAILLQETNKMIARDALEIFNDADRVPTCNLQPATCSLQPATWNLSISHSNQHALCAVNRGAVGADLEIIEPRAENFSADYFTANEIARVNAAPSAQRDILVTALWCAKEATLKAIHKGLSLDTRAVEISIAPFDHAPERWTPFEIELRGQAQGAVPPLRGWWRVQNGFALTLVGATNDAPDEFPTVPEIEWLKLGVHNGPRHGSVHRRIAETTRHHARHVQRN